MPEDTEDISSEELEQLYDKLDAEPRPSEEELYAEIDRLNKEAEEGRASRAKTTRAPKKRTARHRN
jgi:hypothetical protein